MPRHTLARHHVVHGTPSKTLTVATAFLSGVAAGSVSSTDAVDDDMPVSCPVFPNLPLTVEALARRVCKLAPKMCGYETRVNAVDYGPRIDNTKLINDVTGRLWQAERRDQPDRAAIAAIETFRKMVRAWSSYESTSYYDDKFLGLGGFFKTAAGSSAMWPMYDDLLEGGFMAGNKERSASTRNEYQSWISWRALPVRTCQALIPMAKTYARWPEKWSPEQFDRIMRPVIENTLDRLGSKYTPCSPCTTRIRTAVENAVELGVKEQHGHVEPANRWTEKGRRALTLVCKVFNTLAMCPKVQDVDAAFTAWTELNESLEKLPKTRINVPSSENNVPSTSKKKSSGRLGTQLHRIEEEIET